MVLRKREAVAGPLNAPAAPGIKALGFSRRIRRPSGVPGRRNERREILHERAFAGIR